MPIEIEDADGTIIEFPDGTPQRDILSVMRRRNQEREARTRAGANGPGGIVGAIAARAGNEGPRTPYARAYQRRAREMQARTAPTGNPIADALGGVTDVVGGTLDQMGRNMGYADDAAYWQTRIGQGAENLVRRATGRPVEIPSEVAAEAAQQYERDQQQRVARERPIQNVASYAVSVPAFGGLGVRGRVGALQAGGANALVNLPFALSRQEGDTLQERLPGAALETAAVFGLSSGLQGIANRVTQAPRPNTGRSRAADFEAAGVRPTQAAVSGGTPAAATRMIGENFLAGGGVRRNIQNSLDDTAARARELAGSYGQHGQPENVGEAVQAGVRRFSGEAPQPPSPTGRRVDPALIPTREWSFRSKANAVYDDIFGRISADERGHLAGETGARATAAATRGALRQIQQRVQAPNLAEIINDPQIARIANALEADESALRFDDLRQLRTWVRQQRARPSLTQTIDEAALARLEGALTQDIYDSAVVLGGRTTAHQLRRADQFYRAGMNRIQEALQPFADRSGRGAYDRIIALAREGGRQNSRALQSLRNSLRPDEWREVSATVIDDLGRPSRGAANVLDDGAFSVEQFVSNYARLSEEGRNILFGGSGREGLREALDTLARVAGYQKGVERMANASRSGINAQNFGSIAGLAYPGTTVPTVFGLLGAAITGEVLTNPAFVRWLASAPKAGASASGMRRHIAALAQIAARDPALAPVHAELVRNVADRSLAQTDPQPSRREPAQ